MGEFQQALTQHEASHKIDQKLATAEPSDAQSQRDLAISHDNIGDVLVQMGEFQQALTHYGESRNINQKIVIANPGDSNAMRGLAVSNWKLGRVASELVDYEMASRSFSAGINVLEQMIATGQLEQLARQQKSVIEEDLAICNICLISVGEWPILFTQQAEKLPVLLSLRISLLAMKGQKAEVLQAAEKLLSLEPKSNGNIYNAACGFALCLKLTSGWRGRGPFPPEGGVPEGTEEEQRLRKEYREKAIAALKEAIALGWNDFEHLLKDQDLTALHGDPEFEALFPKPAAEEKPAK